MLPTRDKQSIIAWPGPRVVSFSQASITIVLAHARTAPRARGSFRFRTPGTTDYEKEIRCARSSIQSDLQIGINVKPSANNVRARLIDFLLFSRPLDCHRPRTQPHNYVSAARRLPFFSPPSVDRTNQPALLRFRQAAAFKVNEFCCNWKDSNEPSMGVINLFRATSLTSVRSIEIHSTTLRFVFRRE